MSKCYETQSSTRKRRKERIAAVKAAHLRQEYDETPPTCSDCACCKKPQVVNRVYVKPFCGIGLFPVRLGGNCKDWTGHYGEKLL